MSRLGKLTVTALVAAILGLGWKGRGWLYYMWATWREGRD